MSISMAVKAMATPAFISSVPGPHKPALANPAGHGLQRAQRPNGVQMAQQQDWPRGACFGLRARSAPQAHRQSCAGDAASPGRPAPWPARRPALRRHPRRPCRRRATPPAPVANEIKQSRLLAPGPGQQGAHGDGKIGSNGHGDPFRYDFAEASNRSDSLILRRLSTSYGRDCQAPIGWSGKVAIVWQKCHRTQIALFRLI